MKSGRIFVRFTAACILVKHIFKGMKILLVVKQKDPINEYMSKLNLLFLPNKLLTALIIFTPGPMDANRSTNVSETAASAHYDGHCPLRNLEKVKSNSTSDSGMRVLINENNNTSDLAPVSPPSTTTCRSAYDVVPPPRPAIGYFEQGSKLSSEDVEPEYDVPPQNAQESYDIVPPLRSQLRNSCPLDKSSSSDDSAIADLKTSECESSDYDVPPANQDYDVPPHVSRLEQNYGFSPTSQPAYDIVPPPVGVYNPHQPYSNIDPRPPSGIYDHVPPQVPSKPAHYQSPKPSGPNYDTVPPPSGKLPSENYSEETYDHVPPPVQAPSSTHSSSSGIYDVVPARHNDPVSDYHTEHNAVASPPMSQAPDASGKAYVNLTFPVKDFNSYKKPLPIPPGTMNSERYSGTVISFESHDDVYDVPPKCSTIPSSNQWQQGKIDCLI